jgi:hypothetical protein
VHAAAGIEQQPIESGVSSTVKWEIGFSTPSSKSRKFSLRRSVDAAAGIGADVSRISTNDASTRRCAEVSAETGAIDAIRLRGSMKIFEAGLERKSCLKTRQRQQNHAKSDTKRGSRHRFLAREISKYTKVSRSMPRSNRLKSSWKITEKSWYEACRMREMAQYRQSNLGPSDRAVFALAGGTLLYLGLRSRPAWRFLFYRPRRRTHTSRLTGIQRGRAWREIDRKVDEMSMQSFPASDPPPY